MKVSIITVCLNSEKTIRDTLQSVKQQTWMDIEHIIVDGISSDRTLEIVREYKNTVSLVISEKDAGIYDAMNKGLARASGDVIHFLNSDDAFCDQHVIGDAVTEFEQHPEIELLYGNVIYKSESELMHRKFSKVARRNIIYTDLCHQAVFARKSLFRQYGIFDLQYAINSDYDWLLRVFYGGAATRYFNRDVVYFNAGGRHMLDAASAASERMAVKFKYCSKPHYIVGDTLYRALRKVARVFE